MLFRIAITCASLLFLSTANAQEFEEDAGLPAGESVEEAPIADESFTPETPEIKENELPPQKQYNAVGIKGLNKVTARITSVTAPFGIVMRLGNLEIITHRCVERKLRGLKDFSALLEVWELKQGESPTKLFQGWMFSSNKAASAIEHPVYDVWVDSCSEEKLED